MGLKFGTSGVRGLVQELSDYEVYLFVTAFLSHACSLGVISTVCLGKDLRKSSPQIQLAAAQAIQDFGRKLEFCGSLPTPALAYYAQKIGGLAIMITGSHIPADRNGIKFYQQSGETLKNDEQKIFQEYTKLKESSYRRDQFKQDESLLKIEPQLIHQSIFPNAEALDMYRERYQNLFSNDLLLGKKIIFYQHSSVARDFYPDLLRKLGAEVVCLGWSEEFIPVDTEAVESIDLFQKWIAEQKADAFISTDGDADRPFLIDEKGKIVPGDKIGMIAAKFLKCEAVALPISSNSGIEEMGDFKEIHFTKIGSPFVIEALDILEKKYRLVAGFEANGGFLLANKFYQENGKALDPLKTRDAVLPILCVLASTNLFKISLSQLVDTLPTRYTSSVLVKNCPVKNSLSLLKNISDHPANFLEKNFSSLQFEIAKIKTLDGLRMISKLNEVIHLRPSGNAPEFRCYTEASTQKRADFLSSSLFRKLAELLK